MRFYFIDDPSSLVTYQIVRNYFTDRILPNDPSDELLGSLPRPVARVPERPVTPLGYLSYWDKVNSGWVLEPRDLSDFKSARVRSIDEAAGAVRLKFITDVPGQQISYKEQLDEAVRVKNGSTEDTPIIDNSASVWGVTRDYVADHILLDAEKWRSAEAIISPMRISAKNAVMAAQSVEDVLAASNVDFEAAVSHLLDPPS